MADRKGFPPPPNLSRMVDARDIPTLAWTTWFGVISIWIERLAQQIEALQTLAARTIVITTAVDWPSIPAGGAGFITISASGAAMGDFATASLDPTHASLSLTAQVVAADTIRVWARNHDGSAVDLAAGTTRILLEKHS
jgi:hypothetical protein